MECNEPGEKVLTDNFSLEVAVNTDECEGMGDVEGLDMNRLVARAIEKASGNDFVFDMQELCVDIPEGDRQLWGSYFFRGWGGCSYCGDGEYMFDVFYGR